MIDLTQKYKHDDRLATVIVTKESGTLIQMPNGDIIPGIRFTRVTDDINGRPYAIVKIDVNLGFTEK